MKSYNQYCPVAVGLDHLGDRWTLLILRDLAWYGPARFTDLTTHNPGLPPALLSERLRRLVADGLIDPTPDGRYTLTEAGSRVRPVVDAVAAFGRLFLVDDELTRERLAYLARRLTTLHADELAYVEPITIDFVVGDLEFAFDISPNGIVVSNRVGIGPVVETTQEGLLELISGTNGLGSAIVRGDQRTLFDALRFLQPVPA